MEQGTRFFFSQDRNWFKCVMFSDEKWIVLRPYSNRQNERAYASSDPLSKDRRMCWAGMVYIWQDVHFWLQDNRNMTGNLEMLC